jgi:hypothetical protein
MNIRSLSAMAAVAAALTIAAQARADVIFYLTQGECTGSCGAGTAPALISNSSAVEVMVTGTTGSLGDYTGATVELIAPSPAGGNIDAPVWINVNGTYTTDYTATVSSTSPNTIASSPVVTTGSEDHFGPFDLGTGGGGPYSTVTFTLTAATGYSWTDAADVLTPTTGYGAAYSHGFEVTTAAQYAGYAVPAPLIGHGLPGILAVAGVLFGAGLMERGKKRGSFGVPRAG